MQRHFLCEILGLGTQFFHIDTFGKEISRFYPEFPGKAALAMKFFCIDPTGESQVVEKEFIIPVPNAICCRLKLNQICIFSSVQINDRML